MSRRRSAAAVLAVVLMPVVAAESGETTPDVPSPASGRTEVVIETADGVRISEVTWRIPLPASAPSHPTACDSLSYIRYRPVGSPSDPNQADAVISLQPGAIGGASSFDPLARNTVRSMAARGTQVEVWAIDRRGNCLEDRTGMVVAVEAGDYRIALDYYYRGATVNGRRFAGFLSNGEQAVLADFGVARTVTDWHAVHVAEMPSASVRKQKLFVGGHSLGGPLTTMYLAWDFDGDPSTVADAGHRQVGGFLALDGPVTTEVVPLDAVPGLRTAAETIGSRSMPYVNWLLRLGLLPRSQNLGIVDVADTFTMLNVAAIAARFEPDAESEIPAAIPRDTQWEATLRLLFSRNWSSFVTGRPDLRKLRLTNEAVLGALFDDNSFPTILHSSYGTFDGGPVAEKTVPLTTNASRIPGIGVVASLLSPRPRIIPTDQSRLYTWRNYDQMDGPFAHPQRTNDGEPVTGPEHEVSDIAEVARSIGAANIDFTEAYWPMRQLTDLVFFYAGVRSGDLRNIVHEDFEDHVSGVRIIGGDSWALQDVLDIWPPETVVAEGYGHVDVISAAAVQNDGQPEIVTKAVSDFVDATVT